MNSLKINYTKVAILAVLAAIALVGSALIANPAWANPTGWGTTAQSASATTSPSFMTPGTATTTVVYDSFQINGTNQSQGGSSAFATDEAVLLVQMTASSTFTQMNISFEYSNDRVDWYQDNLLAMPAQEATTTPTRSIASANSVVWRYASSTPGQGVVSATNNLDMKALTVPTPTRYVRAIFTLATTSGAFIDNGAVWAQFVPKKEVR